MAIEICPLAADWGNWADWAAVLVGTAAAAATVTVARLAHKTSKQAVEIAQQQRTEENNEREAKARIVAWLVANEASELPLLIQQQYQGATRHMAPGLDPDFSVANVISFADALTRGLQSFLPSAEKVQDRIHVLPEFLGDDLAILIAKSRTLNAICADLLQMMAVRPLESIHDRREAIFRGGLRAFHAHLAYLREFSDASIKFAINLRQYLKQEPSDYTDRKLPTYGYLPA